MSSKALVIALLAALIGGCVSSAPILYEEAANPRSTSRKILAHQVRRWTTRPVTKFEKRFDFNRNGRLDPDELLRYRMASGYYQKYGNVWKFDKNKDFKFDAEEYYEAVHSEPEPYVEEAR